MYLPVLIPIDVIAVFESGAGELPGCAAIGRNPEISRPADGIEMGRVEETKVVKDARFFRIGGLCPHSGVVGIDTGVPGYDTMQGIPKVFTADRLLRCAE